MVERSAISSLDPLRQPGPSDVTAPAYKDWLHLNVFDHATGTVGLVNTSLHGDPRDRRSVAVGAALFHRQRDGWVTSVEVVPQWQASLGWTSVSLPRTAVAVDPRTGTVAASAHAEAGAIELDLVGTPTMPAFDLSLPLPFGPGWISWHVAPRLRLEGALVLDGRPLQLAGASGYHDHNWGRWHWGDDIGWQWGAFLAPAPAPAVVLSRGTDRLHRRGEPVLTVHGHDRMWTFRGGCVALHREGWFDGPMVRVPGAMAALQAGRRRPRLPTMVRLTADDGYDRLELRFEVTGAAQIVAADPHRRGYSYIHELVGRFAGLGRTGRRSWRLDGLGVFEHVD